MPLEPYSPEYGRKWADDPQEKKPPVTPATPATKFELVTEVVMTEFYPQRDDPPGRAPYGETRTVIARKAIEIPRQNLSQAIAQVSA